MIDSKPGSPAGDIGRLDHIGIAVPDLERSKTFYRDVLGYSVAESRHMPDQGISIAFIPLGNVRIELLAPIGTKSPLTDLLEDKTINDFIGANPQGGIHHLCYAVPDLEAALERVVRNGGRVLGTGAAILGADGHRVIFLDPKQADGVLIELKQL